MVSRINSDLLRQPKIPIGFLNDLTRSSSESDVFKTYARWSSHINSADRTTVAIVDEDKGIFNLMAIDGNQAIATGAEVPIGGTLIGRVYRTQAAEICPDLTKSSDGEAPRLAAGGLKSCMDVPLTAGNRKFGVLAQAFANDPPPRQEDLELLEAIARCLAAHLLLHEQLVQLGELALTDPLTRTFNRRVFEDRLADLWNDWVTSSREFSLAVVDLDHFKSINDRFGHETGDEVLKLVAGALMAASRPGDTVVRMGGEEFCVVLENTGLEQATLVAERLRDAVEQLDMNADGEEVTVTASIGVASTMEELDSPRLVSLLADRALYRAKQSGRNRVEQAA